ncbi:MAG: hypothetical protein QM589_13400 [Thermomicrobiales bacterium]
MVPSSPIPAFTRRSMFGGAAIAAAGVVFVKGGSSEGARAMTGDGGCDPDAAAPGLIGDEGWRGPSFGLEASWDSVRWTVAERSNRWVARSIGREGQPVDCGFGQGGSDRLTLANTMWESGVLVIESYDRGMWTLLRMAEAMNQPGWVANLGVANTSDLLLARVLDDSLAAVAGDDDTPERTVYWQATFPEDDETVIHQLTLHMWQAGAVYALHDLEGIEIAGVNLFAAADLETVRHVIDDYLAENRDATA